jgi:hypothetical protein
MISNILMMLIPVKRPSVPPTINKKNINCYQCKQSNCRDTIVCYLYLIIDRKMSHVLSS